MAISSPLLETSIDGAHGVLVNVTGSMDIGLEEVEVASRPGAAGGQPPDANIIFGAAFDPEMEDEIRVTVIATGFDKGEEAPAAEGGRQRGGEEKRRSPPRTPLTTYSPSSTSKIDPFRGCRGASPVFNIAKESDCYAPENHRAPSSSV